MTEREAIKRIKECRNTPNFQPYIYMNEALNMAIKALEKQIGVKPYKKKTYEGAAYICVSCGAWLTAYPAIMPKYCNVCGQKLDWSDSSV